MFLPFAQTLDQTTTLKLLLSSNPAIAGRLLFTNLAIVPALHLGPWLVLPPRGVWRSVGRRRGRNTATPRSLSPAVIRAGISWVNHGIKLKTIIDLCICWPKTPAELSGGRESWWWMGLTPSPCSLPPPHTHTDTHARRGRLKSYSHQTGAVTLDLSAIYIKTWRWCHSRWTKVTILTCLYCKY